MQCAFRDNHPSTNLSSGELAGPNRVIDRVAADTRTRADFCDGKSVAAGGLMECFSRHLQSTDDNGCPNLLP
jgi:hypothetical protein